MKDNFAFVNINKSDKELVREGVFGPGTPCIRYLPGKRGNVPIVDEVADTKYMVPAGPKMVATHLNSKKSIIATSEAVCAGTVMCYPTTTMAEAEALALFLKNNPVVQYFQKAAKVKKVSERFKWFRKFDLSQIKTGYEYPAEWNLTGMEIEMVENYVK